jgi:hypothetical protein
MSINHNFTMALLLILTTFLLCQTSLASIKRSCTVDVPQTDTFEGICTRLGTTAMGCKSTEYLDIFSQQCTRVGDPCTLSVTSYQTLEGTCEKIGRAVSFCKIENVLYYSNEC